MSQVEPHSSKVSRISHFWEQIFPGIGIGLLVGLLVGLSVSPVVSGVLTTLGGLLAAILGIQPGGDSETARFRVNGTRIGGFGFACVVGVLGGMTLRVQEVFAIPVEKQVEKWVGAGFDTTLAQRIVIFQKTGLLSSLNNPDKLEVASTEIHKSQTSALFNALKKIDLCEKVKANRFGDDPKNQVEQMFEVYRILHRSDSTSKFALLYKNWAKTAERIQSQPLAAQIEVIKSIEEAVCTIQTIE